MNADWHRKNRLSRDASLGERIDWHRRHAESCGCRPVPPSILAKMGSSVASAGPKRKPKV